MLIRSGDTVEVITGDDRGVKSRVILIDRAAGKAIVEGVNRVYKHVRRSQKNPQGGRLSKEMPVQLSNVAFVLRRVRQGDAAGRAVHRRTAARNGSARSAARASGEIAPAKTAHATQAK